MFGLGWPEVIVILFVVVIVFGPKKLPEIGSSLGKTLRGFKDETQGKGNDDDYSEED